jgi:hypothetical protein
LKWIPDSATSLIPPFIETDETSIARYYECKAIMADFDWPKAYRKCWRDFWPYDYIPRINKCICGDDSCNHEDNFDDIWKPSAYLQAMKEWDKNPEHGRAFANAHRDDFGLPQRLPTIIPRDFFTPYQLEQFAHYKRIHKRRLDEMNKQGNGTQDLCKTSNA